MPGIASIDLGRASYKRVHGAQNPAYETVTAAQLRAVSLVHYKER